MGTARTALLGFLAGMLVIPAVLVLLWLAELKLRLVAWLYDRVLVELVVDRVVLS